MEVNLHMCYEDGEVGLRKEHGRKGLTTGVHVDASWRSDCGLLTCLTQSSVDGKTSWWFVLYTLVLCRTFKVGSQYIFVQDDWKLNISRQLFKSKRDSARLWKLCIGKKSGTALWGGQHSEIKHSRSSQYPTVGVAKKIFVTKKVGWLQHWNVETLQCRHIDTLYSSPHSISFIHISIKWVIKPISINWILFIFWLPLYYCPGKKDIEAEIILNRFNQWLLVLRALESHGSSLPFHACLVFVTAFCGTPLSHCSLPGLSASSDAKEFGGFQTSSYSSWSSWLHLGKGKGVLILLLSWMSLYCNRAPWQCPCTE